MANIRIANHVEQAYFCGCPSFSSQSKPRGRRLEGIRYEKRAQVYLLGFEGYLDSPWLRFLDANGWHWCQPDGLHFDFQRGILTIVEIKYQHTPDAWVQMLDLYAPVLRRLFPSSVWKYQYLEFVKWYDPDVKTSHNLRLIAEPFMQQYEKGIHIWK